MKYVVGYLAAAASLVGGSAQAVQVSGNSALHFSSVWNEVLTLGFSIGDEWVQVGSISPAQVVQEYGYAPDYDQDVRLGISLTSPISSATVGELSALSSVQTSGGVLLQTKRTAGLSRGGSLGISNLQIDLDTKRVYADITGNFSGVSNHLPAPTTNTTISTINHFHLFDYQWLTGPTFLNPGDTSSFTVSGLTITPGGYDSVISALRLYAVGSNVWMAVSDYGSITTSITAVPEPSAYGLALAGMAVLAAVKRKRSA